MKYTHLGRSGLEVSRIVLGTMNFGLRTERDDAFVIMDRAHELGINFFDTANGYPGPGRRGRTEEILGEWFAQGGGRRERTVLATKLYGAMDDDWPNSGGLSAANIRRSLDASLSRLGTDHVDLLQFHHIDRNTPWDEIWQGIDVAIQQGKVIYAGSSNFAAWHIALAQQAANARTMLGLVSEQSIYNLLVRDLEREVLPLAAQLGIGVIPYSPLQEGLLAGGPETMNGSRRLTGRAAAFREANLERLQRYETFAHELGVSPASLGLAWLLHRPGIVGPICGPRTSEQLVDSASASTVELGQPELDRLDEIFPPYGAAPEAYGW